MMSLLRDHGDNATTPRYSVLFGGLEAPCVHAGGVVVNSQTTASWVAELSENGTRHFVTGTAAPCTGLFKPVSVDQPLDVGEPTDRADERSLWWRHERLHRRVMRDPVDLLPVFADERDELEQRWLHDPSIASEEAFSEADGALGCWTQAVAGRNVSDRRPRWVRRYWRDVTDRSGLKI
jgi:hypothetical protein